MKSNLLRGFLSIFGSKVGTIVIGLLVTPILVRLLGSAQYGDYAFLLSILGISMIIANAGIFDGTRKYIAEDRTEPNWCEHVLGFYIRAAVVLALAVSAVYVLAVQTGVYNRFADSEFDIYLYVLGGIVISRQAYSVARGGLMGLGLEAQSEPLNVLSKVLFAVFGLSLAYLGYDVLGVLVGHIIASSTVAVISYFLLFKKLDIGAVFGEIPPNFPRRQLLSFNGLSVLLILLTASLYHVDVILLRTMVGSRSTGYYKAALVIAEFLWFVPNALQTVLLHSSSELWSKGETERISELSSNITRYNLSVLAIIAIGIAVLADDFMTLYFGPEFEASVAPLLVLIPGVCGFALARPIFAVGQGKGDLRVLILATGAAALLNVVLNLLLIPEYGTIGAAVATSVSYGLMFVFHLLVALQIGFNPISDIRLFRIAVASLVSLSLIISLRSIIHDSIISLLFIPPLGLITYLLFLLNIGAFDTTEINKIANRLPGPFKRHLRRLRIFE